MIHTPQSQIRNLISLIQRERKLVRKIIQAANDLKAASGDPSPTLLQAAKNLEKAISDYQKDVSS